MEKNKFLGKIIAAGALFGMLMSLIIVLPAFADSNRGPGGRNGRGNNERNERDERFEARGILNSSREAREVGINVNFENKAGSAVSGTARIDVFLTMDNFHDTRIKAKIRNVPSMADSVFEGWLVDTNTGNKLSLGGLKMKENGRAELNFKQLMVNFRIYDKLVISEEPVNDANPAQSTVILEADISNIVTITRPVATTPTPIVTTSVLSGVNEVPATTTATTGFGVFIINTINNTLDFHIIFNGLTGAETAAHIHGFALPGVNAPALFTLPSGSPKNGVWNYLESQEADILAGKTYVNIHSTAFPDGEIRGQISP